MSYLATHRSRLKFGVILLGFLAASRLPAQEPISTFAGHRDEVYALAFSPDGKVIASAGKEGIAKLWDASTGKEIRTFTGHLGDVVCVGFSPDGKTLAVGGGTIAETKVDFELFGVKVTKVPPSGELKLWEVSSGKELKTVKFAGISIRGLVFAKDGSVLMSARSDGKVDWWETPAMRRVKTEKNPFGEDGVVVISRAGEVVPFALERGGMRIWNSEKKEKWSCPQAGAIVSGATTSDGRLIAFGTTEIKVWTVGTGKAEATLGGYKAGIFSLAFSPNGNIIASGSGGLYRGFHFHSGEIKLWDLAAKKELATMTAHKDIVSCLAFSPDGKLLASGSADGTVNLWRVPGNDK
jgi:WD40 repeat protein